MTNDDTAWNFADVWERVSAVVDERPALRQGDQVLTWAQMDRRAAGVAQFLLDQGCKRQEKVAQYLYNCPAYLESVYASWRAGLVPVNTNYRYVDHELLYLWDNADVVAVVFHGVFVPTIDRIRADSRVRIWLWVDDGSGACPGWAVPYETAAATSGSGQPPWGRSGDDLYLLYTGGTTGRPKGVMWRQDDLFKLLNESSKVRYPERGSLGDIDVVADLEPPTVLPACPLMHGTGAFASFSSLSSGGSVVFTERRQLDPIELLDTLDRHRVTSMAIVGDAYARPIAQALEADPGHWDLSALRVIVSSGVMWSAEVKSTLSRHIPRAILVDSLGSSEAAGIATSLSGAGSTSATGRFARPDTTRVIDEHGNDVKPGSGEIGLVARHGHIPIGYYKDPVRTASIFRTIGGRRYSVPGDYATVDADGTIALLGRGSVCINTGGEKVFPEEVEETLKRIEAIADAVVVGVPDPRFGEAVAAIVVAAGDERPDAEGLLDAIDGQLARYKVPRYVFWVDSLERSPNGKVDYTRWGRHAASQLSEISGQASGSKSFDRV